ncbi:unnamed protein product [Merluccius merluccius]
MIRHRVAVQGPGWRQISRGLPESPGRWRRRVRSREVCLESPGRRRQREAAVLLAPLQSCARGCRFPHVRSLVVGGARAEHRGCVRSSP